MNYDRIAQEVRELRELILRELVEEEEGSGEHPFSTRSARESHPALHRLHRNPADH